jgi:hypothetical protein
MSRITHYYVSVKGYLIFVDFLDFEQTTKQNPQLARLRQKTMIFMLLDPPVRWFEHGFQKTSSVSIHVPVFFDNRVKLCKVM